MFTRVRTPAGRSTADADQRGLVVQARLTTRPAAWDRDEDVAQKTEAAGGGAMGGGGVRIDHGVERGIAEEVGSSGEALEPATRSVMEARFGHDFGAVRVHADRRAAESARGFGALAYTTGRHIVFGDGQYAPRSALGQQLLAHELTHVVQQSQAPINGPGLSVQRKPDDSTRTAQQAPPRPPVRQAGLNRTLWVVQNDVWNALPKAVRDAAEKELNAQFAFVGASTTEKPFTIKIVPRAQLPEALDFSESVVSVIKSDAKSYVQNAFETQEKAIQAFLTAQHVRTPAATTDRAAHDPSALGSGGGSTRIVQGHALHIAAGAVAMDEVIDGFLENVDSFVSNKLERGPGRGRDIGKWPVDISSGPSHWNPLEMLGQALGRVIAHEARHEYIIQHADTGLGQDAPFPTGEKTTANFSKEDKAAILARIKEREAQQGSARLVPVFPQSARGKDDDFPF